MCVWVCGGRGPSAHPAADLRNVVPVVPAVVEVECVVDKS